MPDSLKQHYKIQHRRGVLFSIAIVSLLVAIAWFWHFAVLPYQEHFLLYFNSDVHGLSVGAPVKMNGQDFGQVKKIALVSLPEKEIPDKFIVAVSVTLNTKTLAKNGYLHRGQTFEESLQKFVKLGLRGRLLRPSMLANGLCVDLYFAPNQSALEINLPEAEYPEIPTNYISSSELVDNANTFIETRNLYEISDKIRSLRGIVSTFDKETININGALLNAKILAILEQANAGINPSAVHKELSAFNALLDSFCRDLEQKKELSQERQEEIRNVLRKLSTTFFEIRQNARAIQHQFDPEVLDPKQRLLQELRKQYEPLIQLGRALLF